MTVSGLRMAGAVAMAIVIAVAGTSAASAQRSRTPPKSAQEEPAAAQEAPAPAEEAAAPASRPPATVTVVTLSEEDVTLTSTLPGRVVASGVAEVRPQVDGIIVERLFEEGANVSFDDPLYRIDPATYEANVAAAKAQVAQAEARYKAAVQEHDRTARLQGRGVVSEQAFETTLAARDAAHAELQVAKAQLQTAEIDLERTTIRAKLSGVIGRSLTTQGALVTAGQVAPLAVIRKIDPVLVDVTQSAAEVLEWRRGQLKERLATADQTVTLQLADGSRYEWTGALTAAEPYVNERTGVVTLRLEFPNPDRLLLPGMYVQVVMPQGVAEDVVLAPQQGVTRDRRGRPIAFVVNEENVVERRELVVAAARGSSWIVTGGLTSGDRLVIEGLQRIAPQATVIPEERVAAADADGTPPDGPPPTARIPEASPATTARPVARPGQAAAAERTAGTTSGHTGTAASPSPAIATSSASAPAAE